MSYSEKKYELKKFDLKKIVTGRRNFFVVEGDMGWGIGGEWGGGQATPPHSHCVGSLDACSLGYFTI